MLQNLKANNKGSATLESIFVISAILLILAALIFAFMILYQKSVLSKAASLAAQQGAEIWVDSRKAIETGAVQYNKGEKDSIYWALMDLGANNSYEEVIDSSITSLKNLYEGTSQAGKLNITDRKLAQVRKAVYKELYRGFLKPEFTKLTIEYNNSLLQKQIQVTLKQEIKIPFGGIKKFFSGKETVTLTGSGRSEICMPADYIRNVDLGVEYVYRMKEAIDINSTAEKILKSFKSK